MRPSSSTREVSQHRAQCAKCKPIRRIHLSEPSVIGPQAEWCGGGHYWENDMEPSEPMGMVRAATGLFAIAALGGLLMAGIRLAGKRNPPTWLAMLHGLLAGAGLTLLIYAALTVGLSSLALIALALFVLAAIGGVVLNLVYHWKQLPLPVGLMIGHAVLAVVAFGLLLVAAFG